MGMKDEEFAAEVRRCEEALNKAIKAATGVGIVCSMRLGGVSCGRPSILVYDSEAGLLSIEMSHRL